MFIVYILKSSKNEKRYVGQTSKNIFERLDEHNRGCNKWTRQNGPFKIIYFEEFTSRTEAIKREHFLKSGQGRKWFNDNIENKISKTPR